MRSVTLAGLFTLLAGSGWGQVAQAQEATGRIVGRIVDASTGKALSSAQVAIVDRETLTVTDLDGRYFVRNVPAGVYEVRVSLLGYAPKNVTGVEVRADQSTPLDVSLEQTAIEVEAITVTARMERGATASLLETQKNAVAVTEAVGAQEISKSPDSDAAEVAARVSSVTVAEGRYVYIRGLGERYSQTSLNGSPIPSPQPEKEVVPLDLFPADFIQSLTTQKTYTPDRPGEFSGGSVEIQNKEFPSEFTWKISTGSSLNTRSQFQDGYLRYNGSVTDWLGIDSGARAIPDAVKNAGYGIGGDRLPSSDPATIRAMGEAFASSLPQFAPTSQTTPVNGNFGASVGDRTSLLGKPFGYLVAGNYGETFKRVYDEVERKWRAEAFDPQYAEASEPNVNYTFDRGVREVVWGGIANFNMLLSPSHQIGLQTMYNRNADDEARTYQGGNREDIGAEIYSERLRFESRSMAWGQLLGKHDLSSLKSRVEWRFSMARAGRDEPGLRETLYQRPFTAGPDDPFVLESSSGESGRYFYSELTDDDLNAGLDWTYAFRLFNADASFKFGGAWRDRSRDFAARRYRWRFPGGVTSLDSLVRYGNIVGTNPKPGELQLTDIVEPGDQYTADDTRLAGYGMFDVPVFGDRLRAVVGARVEHSDLQLDTPGSPDLNTDLRQTDILPALNVTYVLNPDMNLRAAASRTIDRPEFRELAPFQFTEASSLRQLQGNPNLQIADIYNADLKWEWFPNPGEVLSVGGFYKYLDRPIEQVFFAAASSLYSFQNAENGHILGAEMTVRKRLDLSEFWSHFSLGGGFSLIESQVTVRREGGFNPTRLERPLQGQSPYTVNASLSWQSTNGGTELGLYYNVFGERIEAAGGSGVPDITQQPRNVLDFTVSHRVTESLSLKLKAENLLNEPYQWTQEANGIRRVQRTFKTGQSFGLSLSYSS
jgi:hypothetical protein